MLSLAENLTCSFAILTLLDTESELYLKDALYPRCADQW